MAQTYLVFDFGTDEEKAQQARHKLEGWKQAFRLDKKLQYKMDRGEVGPASPPETAAALPETEKAGKAGASKTGKTKTKSGAKEKASRSADSDVEPAPNGKVGLLIRLYFSGHEKLTEQRWIDRIPGEEPFKNASPRVVREGEAQFDEIVSQFDSLE